MKFLAKLEKTTLVWLLIGLCLLFFFLRLPSLIEPYWYGDEGIYEVIGQSMDHGRLLYRDIWDNKPPLLYVVYALVQGDQPTIKTVSLIVGVVSVIIFFLFSQQLFHKKKLSLAITLLFVLLLGTPILEGNIANAEDFILLPIMLAGLLLYDYSHLKKEKHSKKSFKFLLLAPNYLLLESAGLLLGIAFLFKTVAIFDTAAFILFFFFIRRIPTKIYTISFLLSFLLPFFVALIYFFIQGGLADFLQSAFFDNVDYVGWKNTLLGIPQGLLIIKIILLIGGVFLIYWKRKRLPSPALFVLLWFVFSFFNAFFSGRPYTHYTIVLLPSFCLLIMLFFVDQAKKNRQFLAVVIIASLLLIGMQFRPNVVKSYEYYQNAIQFITNQKTIENYQSFFDPKVPRDYTVASFITSHTTSADNVFLWGNNAQIYTLSHKLPLGKYVVAYHVGQDAALKQTQIAIQKGKPKYVIILTESQPLPFNLPIYIMRYSIPGATIYERNF